MILEIFYRGEKIRQTEMPDGIRIEDMQFAVRMESKGETVPVLPPDFSARLKEPANTGKKLIRDRPRVSIPEEPAARFERPKAVYSNPAF